MVPLTRRGLQVLLGLLWLLDGLLQLQPSMFTSYLSNGIMQSALAGQPQAVTAVVHPLVMLAGQHVVLFNSGIAAVQLGLGLALLTGRLVRPALLASVAWSLGVWIGGEGLGMLLTGGASALTGAPGAVLLYALLALAAYPRPDESNLPAIWLRGALAGFWLLAAGLQLQPQWWQRGQISGSIAANESPGTLSGTLLDPSLRALAHLVIGLETPLNAGFIGVALAIALGLASRRSERLWPLLLTTSIALSLLLWWATEGCGQLLTGSATDVNSGPLLVVAALACWPQSPRRDRPRPLRQVRRALVASGSPSR